jgi:hypothetical protein
MIVPSHEIWHRDDFPLLCNWRHLWRAAEIGVDRAEWACLFLDRFQGHEWWGIDDYSPYPEMAYGREADYAFACQRLTRHASRARLIRERSVDAAKYFPDGFLDFVYIDGAHDYESVKADIGAWWRVLSDKGILAGHDWTDHPLHAGVKRAVTEFAASIGQTVYLTSVVPYNIEECPSWYIYRRGIPGAEWKRC